MLANLLQHGALSDDAIAFLWQLTQDATTFEGVKSNAYGILASLGPHLEPPQLAELFTRLQARAATSGVSEATSICALLVGMAQQDKKVRRSAVCGGRWGCQHRCVPGWARWAPPPLNSAVCSLRLSGQHYHNPTLSPAMSCHAMLQVRLAHDVLACLLEIQTRPGVRPEVAGCNAGKKWRRPSAKGK